MKKISKKIIERVFRDFHDQEIKNYVVKEAERIINGDKLPLRNGCAQEAFGYVSMKLKM